MFRVLSVQDAALMAAYEECKHAGREGGVDWIGVSERMGSTRSALAARTHFVNVLMPKNLQEKQLGQWDPQEVSKTPISAHS
jgi:hypothetical protein